MSQLVECVPNFSEGRDKNKIKQITDIIEQSPGVKLLDVDPGYDTNRIVVTFVGDPESVIEAAFRSIQKASEIIDMRTHHGAHPRFGACDVCPLIPLSNITMDETVTYARRLAKRVGEDLHVSVYCYEHAAYEEKRRSLSSCREGEYEGLKKKLLLPEWKPDFGPVDLNVTFGAVAIGARSFLIAYNVNLNTSSSRRACAVAFDVREQGRIIEKNGTKSSIPGTLKKVKAIGWYMKEYGYAQVSMNLTDISVTPMHIAFDEVERCARERGLRVTGSEVVGLIPLSALIDAGKHYLKKQQRSVGIPEREIIQFAIRSMGLSETKPFRPEEKVVEYILAKGESHPLRSLNLEQFSDELSSESTAPGGGSAAAYIGALGAALGTMVANLSSHKRGWDDRWEEFSEYAEKGEPLKAQLIRLVDEDTKAFHSLMDSFSLPSSTAEEASLKADRIQSATRKAIEVPLQVMRVSLSSMDLCRSMIEKGNPNSVTDAGVGVCAGRAAVLGAFMNVVVNLKGIKDRDYADKVLADAAEMKRRAIEIEEEAVRAVDEKLMKM